MGCRPGAGDRINSFALVSYLPEPLGPFLDRVRNELVSCCFAQSHVTILPPRTLDIDHSEVERELNETVQDLAPFPVELTEVHVFDATSVIYLRVGLGAVELQRIHDRLNRGPLRAQEVHTYHPHLTLAQDFPPEDLAEMVRLSQDRWANFAGRKTFEVECLTFVQNTTTNRWLDLARFPLGDSMLCVR